MNSRASQVARGARSGISAAAVLLLIAGCAGGPAEVEPSEPAGESRAQSSPPASPPVSEPANELPQSAGSALPSSSAAQTAEPNSAAAGGGSAAGSSAALADGYPEALLPVIEGSDVAASTVDSADGLLAVSLVAVSGGSAEEVLQHYANVLAEQGFDALGSDSIEGTASQTFIRENGEETVTVSAVESAEGTTYTVGAHLFEAPAE